ncbi:MBOAT family O-acyltransferase [Janthinobacterium sp. 17J80-10]|uniref:MBOAT family O-acyltransferase n=1 Tax=Janthinobacterium sp. 17J80-10 TaxID=2497863 RepID=UPI001005640C|nr:MBOAT family O-acyltransferase [Janthinobacterium sp. 17J80-10]QAU33642.1 MBOAT family protein [Janthinobacterium sp. 17J80-10]
MLFNSFTFLIFFLLVYCAFWALPTWKSKKLLLLAASYIFYAAWSPPYVGILLFCTVLDWWLARQIDFASTKQRRRTLLVLSLACNLGILGYFKYGQFLLDNFIAFLSAFGVTFQPVPMSIILPVGISFYTFASLSYTIDVYRREIRATTSFTDYALFVSFFPHLVAGPIVRASLLLPQFAVPRRPTSSQIGWGCALIIMGLVMKVVLADAIFAPVANEFYAAPSRFSAPAAWAAVLSFSGQIYYDFSGYSLCAIGLALSFGFSFPDNFRHPYAARSFSDFWRRWHISLSTWLRDYLYIPLGGNRSGMMKTYVFLVATMIIGGIWHGASWMFVLWGALHGSYLALERVSRKLHSLPVSSGSAEYRLQDFLIFIVITLTWIPFRATSPTTAFAVLESLVRFKPGLIPLAYPALLAAICLFVTVWWHVRLRDSTLENVARRLGPAWLTVALSLCLIALFLYSGGDQHAFIYFQF